MRSLFIILSFLYSSTVLHASWLISPELNKELCTTLPAITKVLDQARGITQPMITQQANAIITNLCYKEIGAGCAIGGICYLLHSLTKENKTENKEKSWKSFFTRHTSILPTMAIIIGLTMVNS
jgi:hypothetical protein